MSTPAPERPELPPFEPSARGGVKGLLIGAAAAVAVVTLAVTALFVVRGLVDDGSSGTTPAAEETAPADGTTGGTEDIDAAGGDGDAGTEPDLGTSDDEESQVLRFGEVATFADGSTLTAGEPRPFTRSEIAAGGEDFDQHMKVKITFVNNSGEPFDPSLTTTSMVSGEREGDEVFQEDLVYPESTVRPGRKITWWTGYGVDDPDDLQLTVSMGFMDGYEDVIFTP
jgi:hypothetical protein